MKTLTLFYILPSIVFCVTLTLWLLRRRLPRPILSIPILACYGMAIALLWAGQFHGRAVLELEALELDLQDRAGTPRVLSVGGGRLDAQHRGDAIYIPGYPRDALRLAIDQSSLRLLPGTGYQKEALVMNEERLLTIAEQTPRLVPLFSKDEIRVIPERSVTRAHQWTLGSGRLDLTPSVQKPRIIGGPSEEGDSGGLEVVVGYLPHVFSIQRFDSDIELIAGPGMTADTCVLINGRRVFLDKKPLRIPWKPGKTTLTLGRFEPLAGNLVFDQGEPIYQWASLDWKGNPQQETLTLPQGKTLTIGGSPEDHFVLKHLPPRAFLLVRKGTYFELKPNEESEEEVIEEGLYFEEPKAFIAGPGASFSIGPAGSSLPDSFELISENETHTIWRRIPLKETHWDIPNRKVEIPLVGWKAPLTTRLHWMRKAYPLSHMVARHSDVHSSITYGPTHPHINGATLLLMEPNVEVWREGEKVPTGDLTNLIEPLTTVEFLQLDVRKSVSGQQSVTQIRRVRPRQNFAGISVRPGIGDRPPSLRMNLLNPEVVALDLRRLKSEDTAEDKQVRFSINEPSWFSTGRNSIEFPNVSSWFSEAGADIELTRTKVLIDDDYGQREISYDTPFSVGQDSRMILRIIKRNAPWKTIGLVLVGGILAAFCIGLAPPRLDLMLLLYGVSFISCSRLLYSQAVLVNPPHDDRALLSSLILIIGAPLLILITSQLFSRLQIKPWKRLQASLNQGFRYPTLVTLALLVFAARLVLAFAGFKESIDIFGPRLALSLFFTPAYLVLFVIAITRFLRDCRSQNEVQGSAIIKFFAFTTFCLFPCQVLSGLFVSDLGTFVYMIAPTLVMALKVPPVLYQQAKAGKFRSPASALSLTLWVPATLIIVALMHPLAIVEAVPGGNKLRAQIEHADTEVITKRNILRLLQFIDSEKLVEMGTDLSEDIAQDHAIVANYAQRGLLGEGYLQVDVIPPKFETAQNDNVAAVFVFGQFGIIGAIVIIIAYLAVIGAGVVPIHQRNQQLFGPLLSLLAALTFSLSSLYMLAANYGFLPFTGRNMYYLGLNSFGDLVEGSVLVALIIIGWCLGRREVAA